jgi:hypothetical protein
MSRLVVKRQVEAGGHCGGSLQALLNEFPALRGWSMTFELFEHEEGTFLIRVKPVHNQLETDKCGVYTFGQVPVIRDYLQEIGAFELFYTEAKQECAAYLESIRIAFNIIDPLSRAEDVVQLVQNALYQDCNAKGEVVMNPEKSWDSETFTSLGSIMQEHGLVPDRC